MYIFYLNKVKMVYIDIKGVNINCNVMTGYSF